MNPDLGKVYFTYKVRYNRKVLVLPEYLTCKFLLRELNMSDSKSTDRDYQVYKFLLDSNERIGRKGNFNDSQKLESLILLYTYFFEHIHSSIPEYRNLIINQLQTKVFGLMINNYLQSKQPELAKIDIGDFINMRAALYEQDVKHLTAGNNHEFLKCAYSIFESPLEPEPPRSKNPQHRTMLLLLFRESLKHLEMLAETIIKNDFTFGSYFQYQTKLKPFYKENPFEITDLRIVLSRTDHCKKFCRESELTGGFPRGREFIQAIKDFQPENSKEITDIMTFVLFEKWIEIYRTRYGYDSLSEETIHFIENQIMQEFGRLNLAN